MGSPAESSLCYLCCRAAMQPKTVMQHWEVVMQPMTAETQHNQQATLHWEVAVQPKAVMQHWEVVMQPKVAMQHWEAETQHNQPAMHVCRLKDGTTCVLGAAAIHQIPAGALRQECMFGMVHKRPAAGRARPI